MVNFVVERPSFDAAIAIIMVLAALIVLAVNPAEFAERYGALPPQQLVEHLRRHGAAAEGIWLDSIPTASIAGAVLNEAHKVGADLIVAGAFGHPKLWEKFMGGVTRDLLAQMTLPF